MVILTGSGAISTEYRKHFNARIVSLRKTNEQELILAIQNASVIIHNSANCNPQSFQQAFENNTLATYQLINLTKDHNPNAIFLNLGSMSYLQNATEYKHPDSMNAYTLSKWIAEKICLENNLKNITSLRFSTLFYNDPTRDGLSKLIYDARTKKEIHLINQGIACRDFIPTRIAVQYLKKLTLQKNLKPTYNIVSGQQISFKQIALHLKNRIPDLVIHNTNIDSPSQILSDFTNNDTREIGDIHFSLFDEIDAILETESKTI